MSGLATAHSTRANELANTNNIAQINAVINNNASAIANYNIGNLPMSTMLPKVQQFCPWITEGILQSALEQWNASQLAGMQANGISPTIQSLLQAIQALEAQAGSGPVNYLSPRRHAGPHLVKADYTGGAHLLEVNKWAPYAFIASSILAVMAVFAAPEVICVIAGYELTLQGSILIMAGISGVVGSVDELNGW